MAAAFFALEPGRGGQARTDFVAGHAEANAFDFGERRGVGRKCAEREEQRGCKCDGSHLTYAWTTLLYVELPFAPVAATR